MFLYILYSAIHNRHYIGITSDTVKRLDTHNQGYVRSTKAYRPWTTIYTEVFETKKEARKREIFLKGNGRKRQELLEKIHTASSSNG